jgi:hypothetical protein
MLQLMVNCEVFGMEESFQGTCFGHAFSKACFICSYGEIFMKRLAKTFGLFLSNLPNQILKNGLKSWGRVEMNGTRHV